MNINIEDLGPCKKKVHAVFETAEVESAIKKECAEYQQVVALPGFRKGKAPLDMVRKAYEKEVNDGARRELKKLLFKQLKEKHSLEPIYELNYEELKFNDKEYEYVSIYEIAPVFELPNYKGLPAKRVVKDVTDKDVEDAVNALRQRQANYQVVDRPAAPGDYVVINYTANVDGKPLSEVAPDAKRLATGEKQWVKVQKDAFLPGFGEQFVGAKKGDKLQVTVEFPPEFIITELARKKGVFDVEVVDVQQEVLPDLNDEFAKSYGAQNVKELQDGIRFDLKRDLYERTRQSIRDQVVEELMARVNFDLPENELSMETRDAVLEIVVEQQKRGLSKEDIEKHKDDIFKVAQNRAKNRIKGKYVFKKIAEKEGIDVAPEEIQEQIFSIAKMRGEQPKKYLEDVIKAGRYYEFYDLLLAQKVIDFLVEYAKIEDVMPQ
ncbi:MAG: trigger factor [Verrucomicrobiae bacterium]|nr:trigger factor [Verrucomicrobiae bacterium]